MAADSIERQVFHTKKKEVKSGESKGPGPPGPFSVTHKRGLHLMGRAQGAAYYGLKRSNMHSDWMLRAESKIEDKRTTPARPPHDILTQIRADFACRQDLESNLVSA